MDTFGEIMNQLYQESTLLRFDVKLPLKSADMSDNVSSVENKFINTNKIK